MELGLGIEFKEYIELGLGDRGVEIRWSQVQRQKSRAQMELGLVIEFKDQMELGLEIEVQRSDGARFRDRGIEIRWNQVQGQSYEDQMELG